MIWRITKHFNSKTYFYVGKENRGRRVWSVNIRAAATWVNKEDAVKIWETDASCEGAVTGSDSIEDIIEAAWLKGEGWMI